MRRVDRPVLVSNLVAGALWLLVPVGYGSPLLALVGLAYVVAASLFLAAAYGRGIRSRKREAVVWATPWLAAVVLWSVLALGVDHRPSVSHWGVSAYVGLVVGTGCYLAWQVVALAVRQAMRWRSLSRRA